MGKFELESTIRLKVPFVYVEGASGRVEQADLLLDVGDIHVSFKL